MKKLLLLITMLLSQPVWAEWIPLAETSSGIHYVDPLSVRKTPNGRRMWTLLDHDLSKKGVKGPFPSEASLMEFDCTNERSRTLQSALYSRPLGRGEVLSTHNIPSQWLVASPGALAGALLDLACKLPLQ
jgi:hypothetical protein